MPTLRLVIDARGAEAGARRYEGATKRVQGSSARAAGSVARLAAAFITLQSAQQAFRVLANFERGLVGVGKTTDITGEALQELGGRFRELALRMPVATEELLAIGQAAGQLGIKGSDNIILFTETIAKLGTATDLSGERAAIVLARLLAVTNESTEEVFKLASVLTALGNSVRASESEIAEVALKVGQATAAFKLSSTEVLALSASIAELGGQSELASSSIFRSLSIIEDAVKSNNDQLSRFAELAGVTQQEFRDAFARSATDSLRLFFRAIQRGIESGRSFRNVLQDLGIQSVRDARLLGPLATRLDEVAKNFEIAEKEAEELAALDREFAQFLNTLQSDFDILINTVKDLIITMGEEGLIDALRAGIQLLTKFVNLLRENEDLRNVFKFAFAGVFFDVIKRTNDALGGTNTEVEKLDRKLSTGEIVGQFDRISTLISFIEDGTDAFKNIQIETDNLNEAFNQFPEDKAQALRELFSLKGFDLGNIGTFADVAEEARRTLTELLRTNPEAFARLQDRGGPGADSIAVERERRIDAATERGLAGLRKETVLLGQTEEQRRKLLILKEVFAELQKTGVDLTADEIDGVVELVLKNIALNRIAQERFDDEQARQKKREEDAKRLQDLIVSTGVSIKQNLEEGIADALTDVILGIRDIKDAFEDLFRFIVQSTLRLVIQRAIVAPIVNTLLSGFGGPGGAGGVGTSQQGNVFNSGRIVPFQQGGVVSQQSFFPLQGGIGTIAETGPEAILPLQRDSQGDLGVKGGRSITVNIFTRDADSFRRSQRQVAQSVRRAVGGI